MHRTPKHTEKRECALPRDEGHNMNQRKCLKKQFKNKMYPVPFSPQIQARDRHAKTPLSRDGAGVLISLGIRILRATSLGDSRTDPPLRSEQNAGVTKE